MTRANFTKKLTTFLSILWVVMAVHVSAAHQYAAPTEQNDIHVETQVDITEADVESLSVHSEHSHYWQSADAKQLWASIEIPPAELSSRLPPPEWWSARNKTTSHQKLISYQYFISALSILS